MLKVKKIKPMFTALITTMDKYEHDMMVGAGLIDVTKREGSLKEYQRVLAVGSSVRDIKVGDLVWVNPTRFGVKKHNDSTSIISWSILGMFPCRTYQSLDKLYIIYNIK
jgi:hypothetical protein